MQKYFHHELEMLKQKLLNMANKVQEMLSDSINALINSDASKIEMLNKIEHEINVQEIDIDQHCLKLIALHQPVGEDLRLLNIISKINNDLERIADETVNIGERVTQLIKNPKLEQGDILPQMVGVVREMLNKSINAIVKNDIKDANEIFSMEEKVDTLHRKLVKDVIEQMKRKSEITELGLDIIFISHRLERIGDMAVNIIEDVMYFVTGEDARHPFDKKKQE
ncbi:MAG: phosphate transport system regulatory protein PhoU [Elusimicrobia bacterium RIFOXYC2_FULL_34_12]|nr:MAG: phosphate transport system regulatory protein PhoU [Elusimicrobia bacterium RIFOXYC2_FULL_34_12]OGS39350.1 MAG: phosphate transport system regulatory protein PhoU [Elusimicrobia bacterium RIFOXYD2_FULL_34_30]